MSFEGTEDVEVIQGNVRVTLEWIGEGYSGDYDEDDPEDEPLMRFSVSRLVEGEWEEVDSASYCTRISAKSPREQLQRVAEAVMREIHDDVVSGTSVKKKCEWLSWITLEGSDG